MADDLIAECQETRKELYLPSPSSICKNNRDSTQSHQILNFEDFLEKFNEIHDILHSMQTSASHLSENEYEKLYSQCQYFKEQASLLKLMYPDSKDDINRRCNILSNKLDIIERMMFPQRSLEKNETIQSLTSQMKNVRKWLQEMEGKLRKLKCNDDCETDEMAYVFNQEKRPTLKCVLKYFRCEGGVAVDVEMLDCGSAKHCGLNKPPQ
ncbi:uncharacterized protein CDAR_536771 [Caerostris darwini]|uniref:Uncharacterized protein n=1 Tax=Caerostris darwini TaxID=1538125 RepID=A0AAV4VIU4_9ARAC|nr:uncharacterized protein CDAR_536771 [Caerostris darwini]